MFNKNVSQIGRWAVLLHGLILVLAGAHQTVGAATGPSVVTQPSSQVVLLGNLASFQVVADGTPPLSYQWWEGTRVLTGATNASCVVPSVTTNDHGQGFFAVVSNSAGSVTSKVAILWVDPGVLVTNTVPVMTLSDAWLYNQSGANLGTAWYASGYNDSAWPSGPGPFDAKSGTTRDTLAGQTIGTHLSLTDSTGTLIITYYFRTLFTFDTNNMVSVSFRATTLLDDGAIWYLNGAEMFKVGADSGISSSTLATRTVGDGAIEYWDVQPSNLISGYNHLAAELHQCSTSSSDVTMGLALNATVVRRQLDLTPPVVAQTIPASGGSVVSLSEMDVQFNEPVAGVDASDLLVDGSPATNLVVLTPNRYIFQFAPLPLGPAQFEWAAHHGITDTVLSSNAFAGGGWSVTVDTNVVPAKVVISEFLASNTGSQPGSLKDENGDYSDWIEIHNEGNTAVNLEGWSLTDDPDSLTKWVFPATNLNAGGYMVIFASNKNRRAAGAPLHTNFRLSSGGDYLALVQPDGAIATEFSPFYPPQIPDVSFGYGILTQDQILISTNSQVRVLVPRNGNDGDAWTLPGYDDSAWLRGTNGVGFGSTNVPPADYGAVVLGLGPVGYWRMNEASGGILTNRGSGAGLNATPSAVTLGGIGPRPPDFPGFEANNSAPTFVGGSSYVGTSAPLLSDRSAFTMAGWVKPVATPGSRIGLFGQNDCVEFGFISGATLQCWTAGGGSIDVGYPYAMNTWHHITVVGSGVSLMIYLDGALAGSGGSSTASYGSSSYNFNIGGGGIFDASGNSFSGQIDEVAFFSRALSAAEVLSLYRGGTEAANAPVIPYLKTDIGSVMSNANASAYIRLPFELASTTNFSQLTLRVRYNDGFVASLNGDILVQANAPDPLAFDSAATGSHSVLKVEDYRFGPDSLVPGLNVLAIQGLNVASNNPDFLIAAELIAAKPATESESPLYFSAPTPGAANLGGALFPGPSISEAAHAPNVPLVSQNLLINAKVVPTFNPVATVVMRYRVMFGSEIEVPMFDDGTHGDGAAGDGVYGAAIPSGLATNGQMIRWYFRATDDQGNASRWPLFTDPGATAEYLGTIVNPTNVTSKLPIIHLFVSPAQMSAVDTKPAGGRASLFYDGELYDNIFMRVRGNTTAGYTKKSHRMEFNREHLFRHPGPGGARLRQTSFTADYPDPTYMRQRLTFWLCEQFGAPGPFYHPIRFQMNADFYQLANHNDLHGEELLDRLGYDPNGALYNSAGTVETSKFSTGGFDKKTRQWDVGDVDYLDLANKISESQPAGQRRTNLFELLDLPEVINYLVVARFVQENDDVWANMSLYHDNDGDGRWRIIPFDMNLSWGAFFYDNAANDNGIQATNDVHKSHPLYGSSQALSLTSANYNRVYDAIFLTQPTREMFLRRMRTFLDTWVLPPGTATNASVIEQTALSWRDLIAEEAQRDRVKWGWPAKGGQCNFDPGIDLTNGVRLMLNDFFRARRGHFYGKHSATNTALAIGVTKYQNAGIPLPAPANASPRIADIDYCPLSGNQAQEYICLTNPTPFALDISGWRLEGAVQHVFHPGTVIPTGYALYVSPDLAAFRARATGPRGGQGLFVQGSYQGSLSARGETIEFLDDAGRFVQAYTYAGNPSLAQRYLRITEIMYNPDGSGDAEYIEVRNISTSVTLDLKGVWFANGIDFKFTGSAVTSLAPGQRAVVVRSIPVFTARYGSGPLVAGQFAGSLNNGGERIQLLDARNEEILDFSYDNKWYPVTDGLGFSLVVVDEGASPDAWNSPANWRPSGQPGGAPAGPDAPAPSFPPVVINEVLARVSTPPPAPFIELHNPSTNPAPVGGWFLTDDRNLPNKFRIPDPITVPAGGCVYFDETYFNPAPGVPPSFALNPAGGKVYLYSADALGALTGYYHSVDYGAATDGDSLGWLVTSDGVEHFPLQTSPSPGELNRGPRVGPVVINEIMYHPPDQGATDNTTDEYIELLNISSNAVQLYDSSVPANLWKITGGIDFVFPPGMAMASGERILLVNFDPANTTLAASFRAKYSVSGGVRLFGPYAGKLNNDSDQVELKQPTLIDGANADFVMVDKVSYSDQSPWPAGADGYGFSLQRRMPSSYGSEPTNWTAAPPGPGLPTTTGLAAPVITLQPLDHSVLAGADVILRVEASGAIPMIFQWQFLGTNLPGATNRLLILTNVQYAQGGLYRAIAYNAAGSAVSAPATVKVGSAVQILQQPQPVTVRVQPDPAAAAITNVTFVVGAYSSSDIRYQWRWNGTPLAGATNASLTITNVSTNNWGDYSVAVSDAAGTVISSPASLVTLVTPKWVQAPLSQGVVVGGSVTLSAEIAGWPPPFYYEWRRSATIVSTNTSSALQTFLVVAAPVTNGAPTQLYRVGVKNAASSSIVYCTTTATLSWLLDTDGDGMPDVWETASGLATNSPSDRLLDPDNDGMANWQEFEASTKPDDSTSLLQAVLQSSTNSPAGAVPQWVLSFQAVSNRTYTVQSTDQIGSGAWSRAMDVVARSTNRLESFTLPGDAAARFYRIVTPRAP